MDYIFLVKMKDKLPNYKSLILVGILIISLGVVFNTALKGQLNSLGTVLIASGGLFFIIGMSRKRNENNQK